MYRRKLGRALRIPLSSSKIKASAHGIPLSRDDTGKRACVDLNRARANVSDDCIALISGDHGIRGVTYDATPSNADRVTPFSLRRGGARGSHGVSLRGHV